MIKSKKLIFAGILFLLSCSLESYGEDGLELSICRPSKNILGYKHPLKISLSNNGKNSKIVPLLFIPGGLYIDLDITLTGGEKSKFIGFYLDWKNTLMDYHRLPPGSTYTEIIDIDGLYSLEKGVDKLRAIYRVPTSKRYDDVEIWHGEVLSNEILIDDRCE